MRGIAALMVMSFHYFDGTAWPLPWLASIGARIPALGQTGVDLFFVLSGFLITRILLEARDRGDYFRNFYARRALRILPLYYGFLAFSQFALPVLQGRPWPSFAEAWWDWVYLQNIPTTFPGLPHVGPGVYWSLAVEEHFYLVWPVLVFLLPTRWIPRVAGAVIVLAFASRAVFLFALDLPVDSFTTCRMDALGFGALLACAEATGWIARNRRVLVALLAAVAAGSALLWVRTSGFGLGGVQLVKYTLMGALYFAALGIVVAWGDAWPVRRILQSRPLVFTGSISYGLYVVHVTCFAAAVSIDAIARHPLARFLACYGFAYLVAWLSFRFYESRFLALKSRFESGQRLSRERPSPGSTPDPQSSPRRTET